MALSAYVGYLSGLYGQLCRGILGTKEPGRGVEDELLVEYLGSSKGKRGSRGKRSSRGKRGKRGKRGRQAWGMGYGSWSKEHGAWRKKFRTLVKLNSG